MNSYTKPTRLARLLVDISISFRRYADASSVHRILVTPLLKDAKRRKLDVLVCWRLDRLGRNLRHLILLLDDLQALGVAFVSLAEGIDATTPAGRLQLHVLGAIAEFERARLAERVQAGLARAKRDGKKLGRPQRHIPAEALEQVRGLSTREAAKRLGIPRSTLQRWLAQKPSRTFASE